MAELPEGRWPSPAPAPAAPPPERGYDPIHPGSGRGDWREQAKRYLGPIAAVAILIATKLKLLLVLLPKAQILTTSGTMLVSIAAYALLWGWQFGVGLVLLLLVHEMGHVIQLRREGIPASAPMFIPFLGAVVTAKSMGDDAAAEARVGLAGPILGTIGTLVPLGIWLATGEEFWQALAYVGFFINLFNLLPVLPLDGGRAMAALSPWVWILGYVGLIAMVIFFHNPLLLLILVFGGFEIWNRWKNRKTSESRAFHDIPTRTRILVGIVYLGLIVALVVGAHETFLAKSFGDV